MRVAVAVLQSLIAATACAFVPLSPGGTIEDAARWPAVATPAGGRVEIAVAVAPGTAEALVQAVTGAVAPDDVVRAERALADALHAWESPVLRFTVTFDGPAVEGPLAGAPLDLFAVGGDHPAFTDNTYFGVAFTRSEPRADRLLTNGTVLPGRAIVGADVFFNVDRIATIAPIFARDEQPHALQRLAMHEVGHALGLHHPNEFPDANLDTNADPFDALAVDPFDPFRGLRLSPVVDPDAVMSNFPASLPGALLFTTLRNDDRSGRDVLYPSVLRAGCLPRPRPDCLEAARSTLRLDGSFRSARRTLTWRWRRGETLGRDVLGTPATTTALTLCLYGDETLTASLPAPGGPGWREGPRAIRYRGEPVRRLRVRAGETPQAALAAHGPLLPILVAPPITAQLVASDAPACLTSRFEAGDLVHADPGRLLARSTGPTPAQSASTDR